MHSFCCVSPMTINNSDMHFDPLIRASNLSAISRASSTRDSTVVDHAAFNCISNNSSNNHSHRELKINDIVGDGVSGILYKWVNYGRGWRPRWFVLQDGVLSYYKIHGPDKIIVNQETEKGSRVIGEESVRRVMGQSSNLHHRNGSGGSPPKNRKPVGEVHLKVSSIRESRSDDRRFSINTGTKRLHLRAESREDKMTWMEVLQTMKDMFPRMSNSELMAPVDNLTVSTEKLKQRLLEEGLSEAAIQEIEQITRDEFSSLQNQLTILKQKYWLLMDTLRQLETEKVDLENTVVDESQRQLKEVGASSRSRQDKYSESASESDFENERVDAAEEDTDEEDNTFFDTKDFLSSGSFKSNGSDFRSSSFSSDDELHAFDFEDDIDPAIRSAGSNFPYVKRRKKLPDPVEKEKGVSLWSMIKDNIGKDLTKVCLPVYFNEPLSSLQKCFEDVVDLAGSERASQSLSAGTRLKEGCHINRSLLTLGTVIRKLSKCRGGHIPYRDSKLTRILQTSLGGNARTAIICTMSPARSHVEQSRNTLLFASCAKEVTTNAKVNVVMSDKALVKYLQRELARLESELRSPQSSVSPSDYSAIIREKDVQIEKLLEEINDAILQRDIAQSQVKDLLQMLGDDDAGSTKPVLGLGHYPHLRVQRSPDSGIEKQETSILADPHCLNVDTRSCSDEISRASTEDHIVEVPYFDEDFVRSNASPRIITSNYSESDSYNGWEEIEKQSNATSEDLCREVRCIETQESSTKVATESNSLSSEENTEVKVYVNGDAQTMESPSTPFPNDRVYKSSPLKNDSEMKEERESLPSVCKKDSSTQYLDILSLGNISFRHEIDKDSSVARSSKLMKSRSCNSGSPWLKMMDISEITSSLESEKSCEKKLSPLSSSPKAKGLSRKDSQSSPEDSFDIEIDTPDVKHKIEHPSEHTYIENQTKEVESKANEAPKRSVKDVGLDPIEDECKGLSGWPVEFKRLQREIVELWHDCNVSLVHRAYFFMLFQGDPSDAIYLEVEIRRMKFLKDKFSKGEKIIVNGQSLTLASSEKALRDERRMLIHRMGKKLLEHERESLYLKWGIGLNTRFRRLQLAHTLWTKTDDMGHVADSAILVAKLVGSTKHGHTHNKEMFGLNFTPRCSTRISSFKRGLISFL